MRSMLIEILGNGGTRERRKMETAMGFKLCRETNPTEESKKIKSVVWMKGE
jgi:hypothetical protein